MEEKAKIETSEAAGQKSRRAFVKTAAQVAVTAPAVAMLLTATTTPAAAYDDGGVNDDFPAP
jgi:hypothetical protein